MNLHSLKKDERKKEKLFISINLVREKKREIFKRVEEGFYSEKIFLQYFLEGGHG